MIKINSDFLVRQVTLRQLQIFVSVAKTQSYTRAAENLYLSQPTVSIQIQKLSNAVGMPLFDCIGKRLFLTIAGEKVLTAAEEILERLNHLSDDVIELQGKIKGELRISSVTNAKYFMPRILGAFLHQYPDVKPALKVTNRSRVLERLDTNQDEIYITGQVPDGLGVSSYPILENSLVVVAFPEHPLAGRKRVLLKELSEQRFLMREKGSGTRIAIDEMIVENNLSLNVYMELGSSEAIKQAVMAGLGIAILSLNNIKLELKNDLIVVLPVTKFPLKKFWNIVHLKDKKLSLVARTFLDFMLQEGNDIISSS